MINLFQLPVNVWRWFASPASAQSTPTFGCAAGLSVYHAGGTGMSSFHPVVSGIGIYAAGASAASSYQSGGDGAAIYTPGGAALSEQCQCV